MERKLQKLKYFFNTNSVITKAKILFFPCWSISFGEIYRPNSIRALLYLFTKSNALRVWEFVAQRPSIENLLLSEVSDRFFSKFTLFTMLRNIYVSKRLNFQTLNPVPHISRKCMFRYDFSPKLQVVHWKEQPHQTESPADRNFWNRLEKNRFGSEMVEVFLWGFCRWLITFYFCVYCE